MGSKAQMTAEAKVQAKSKKVNAFQFLAHSVGNVCCQAMHLVIQVFH